METVGEGPPLSLSLSRRGLSSLAGAEELSGEQGCPGAAGRGICCHHGAAREGLSLPQQCPGSSRVVEGHRAGTGECRELPPSSLLRPWDVGEKVTFTEIKETSFWVKCSGKE